MSKGAGKNITFYAPREVLKVLDDLAKGDKSSFIGKAIIQYSDLAEMDRRHKILLEKAKIVFFETTGKTIEQVDDNAHQFEEG